jgi:anti-sigma factor RsiW
MNKPLVTEADLHAWVDGELPDTTRADVDAWLQAHPQDAARVEQYRRQNTVLRGKYDAVLEEPVPEYLSALAQRLPHAENAAHARPLLQPPLQRYAAMLAALVVGGAGGWYAHLWYDGQAMKSAVARSTPSFVRQAAVAHVVYSPEVRHPVEVGADQEAHLAAWLSKRLGTQLRVPQLVELGFSLVGGRLLPGQPDDRLPVAQFMYQDGKGQRLTLYVRTDAEATRETAFRFAQEKNIGVFYWVDQKLGYALSGEIEKAELLRVANAVYKQLNP